mmetsp:Transcript_15165/g.52699  ORF Transcript_15165/g.52699 Transcript_15165/m.52699 type:complete len:208 (+) Transcript_15165:411-1034(+)
MCARAMSRTSTAPKHAGPVPPAALMPPLRQLSTNLTEVESVRAEKGGPSTNDGLITTTSNPSSSANFHAARSASALLKRYGASVRLASSFQSSSVNTYSGSSGGLLGATAAHDDVTTTRRTVPAFFADRSTLSVPLTAGSTRSRCGSSMVSWNGDAVCSTMCAPAQNSSKEPSESRSASYSCTPGNESVRCFTFVAFDLSRTVARTV